jgi:hypothetical protein
METMDLIAEARVALIEGDHRLWDLVQLIESSIEADPHGSMEELALVRRLQLDISDVYSARNEGKSTSGVASVTLSALEGLVKRRTTGADGWKLA